MPYKFNPFTGKLDYFESGGGGGGDAWSDPVDANIIPDSTANARDLGSATNLFNALYPTRIYNNSGQEVLSFNIGSQVGIERKLVPTTSSVDLGEATNAFRVFYGEEIRLRDVSGNITLFNAFQSGAGEVISIQSNDTTPSGASVVSSITSSIGTGNLGYFTDPDSGADANSTGSLYLETGNKTAGTGASGHLVIQPGTSAGAERGHIFLNGRLKLGSSSTAVTGNMPTHFPYFQTLNTITLTLPSATGLNSSSVYIIEKLDSNATTLTVDGNGAQTIGGEASIVLRELGETLTVISNGSNFSIISHTYPTDSLQSTVDVHTSNGVGSSATRIIRFTTSLTDTGSAITYADSATNGGSFTINEQGLYSVMATMQNSSADREWGVTKNQTTLTNNITSNPESEILVTGSTNAARRNSVSTIAYLDIDDVIRVNTDTDTNISATTGDCRMTITKIRGMR